MFHNLLSATPFYDLAEPVVMWLTIAVVCALVVAGVAAGVLIYFFKHQIFAKYVKTYVKYAVVAFVFYALVVGLLMVVSNLVKRTDPAYLEEKYLDHDVIGYVLVPLIVAMAVALISGVALFAMSMKKVDAKAFKLTAIVLGAVVAASVVAACVTISIYYTNHIKGNGYYDNWIDWNSGDVYDNKVDQVWLYVSAAILIVGAVVAAFLLGRKDKSGFDSRCIALAGVTIALSFALSYIKLWEMPQGGSVTFASLLPVMLFAYVYGPKKGVLVGFIYGLLQAIQDPYIIHPAQFLLDYPIAFAMVGFAGVFADIKALDKFPQVKFILGAVLAGALRFVAHVLSGVFAFSAYALDLGQTNFWIYSLAYNSFVFVDLVLVVVIGAILFTSKAFNRQLALYADKKAKTTNAVAEAAATDASEQSDNG